MDQPRPTSTSTPPPQTPPPPSATTPKPSPPTTNPNSSIPPSQPPQPPQSLNPNPNPPQYTRPVTTSPATQHIGRPITPPYARPWPQQQQQHSSSSSSSSLPVSTPQRGGMALGVPASPSPSPSPAFPGSFGNQFGRGTMSEPTSNTQGRMMPGTTQGIGMMGTLGPGSHMRPSGMTQHQQRPSQSPSLRPVSSPPTSQAPVHQNFQGHGMMRPAVGSPGVQSTSGAQQSMQGVNQPWLAAPGKPPLPSYRPLVNSPSMQQRSHITQQHMPTSAATSQPQEQFQQSRSPQQPLPHPHQPNRVQGLVNQKGMTTQPPVTQPGTQAKPVSVDNEDSDDRILGKRSIHELLQQIDPTEKLDPEVEDILADIAEDFVESITTFGCTLAKHRKSDTLEAKDILLHVERNWNIRPPGFSSEEIKTFKKPVTTDIHKERIAVIKKSVAVTEAANARNPYGHGTANARGGQAKTPANPMVSTTFNH